MPKFNGADNARTRNYIGQLEDAADMLALLAMYQAHCAILDTPDFVLMQDLHGVEVGLGAYFNGEAFPGAGLHRF